jgi:hypothetical protein
MKLSVILPVLVILAMVTFLLPGCASTPASRGTAAISAVPDYERSAAETRGRVRY